MRRVKMVVLAVCLCMVCGVVAARGALESDGVSKETKEMVNLLVRIDRLSAEPCLFLNPKKESLLPKLDGKWNKFLTIPGRYSLYIYLALQVIAVVVLCLITWIATGTIPFI